MFVTNWISTTKIQKISEITNFFRHYFLSRTEVDYSLYGETYKHNIQEAYRVLSSTNRLKPEYDREFDAYRASNDSEYLYSDERTKRDIMLVQKELGGTLLASKKYDTCAKEHNLVIRAVVIYGVFLAIVSAILFVPVKKHKTFRDVYWESL